MPQSELTERQRREITHHEEEHHEKTEIDLELFSKPEFGPWNPYWYIYDFVRRGYQPGQRLLSFGCGRGEHGIRYAKLGYEVYGFDISPSRIQNANRLTEKYDVSDKTHFTVQAAESLNYPSDFFDIIAGENILHHIDIPKSMRETFRTLKPGGYALFKDSIETAFRDRIRNSGLVTRFLPKGVKNLPNQVMYEKTPDERPLSAADISVIQHVYPNLEVRHFRFLSAMSILTRHKSRYWKVDGVLFRLFPFLRRFGDHVVLICRKPA